MSSDGGDGNVLPFPAQDNWNASVDYEADPKVVETRPAPNPEEVFFTHMCNFAQIGLAISRNKNKDYAGNGDPFANFRNSEAVGVSPPRGMLVRMMDKMARLSNLITRPPAIANESMIDTCVDLAMYALILATYVKMHPEASDGQGTT